MDAIIPEFRWRGGLRKTMEKSLTIAVTRTLKQWYSTWGTLKHLTSIGTKHRNHLNLEPALILTLTKIRPPN
jgi:hypothetical protein